MVSVPETLKFSCSKLQLILIIKIEQFILICQLQFGFMLIALIWEFDFAPFMVLIIAILNDGEISSNNYHYQKITNSYCVFLVVLSNLFPHTTYLIHMLHVHAGTIMTISKDRVKPSPVPDSWKLKEIFATGIVLGGYLALGTVLFFWVIKDTDFFSVSMAFLYDFIVLNQCKITFLAKWLKFCIVLFISFLCRKSLV